MIFKKLFTLVSILMLMISCGSKSRVITTKSEQYAHHKKEATKISEDEEQSPKPSHPVSTPTNYTRVVEQYIGLYKGIAKEEMKKYGIPASITLAQGILESAAGTSELAVKANNHFGIKCHSDWKGEGAYRSGDKNKSCFRKYKNAIASYEDHSQFLKRSRYDFLFSLPQDDYKSWAKGLKKAGYAADRKYPKKLIGIIERYLLYIYDAEVLNNTQSTPQSPSGSEEVLYVVKQGDTLYNISKRYGLTVDALMQLNGLTSSTISVGQSLKIKTNNP